MTTEPGKPTRAAHKAAGHRLAAQMEPYHRQVEACLEAGREAHPDRRGYFWLSFTVLPDGRVTHLATIPRGGVKARDVTQCVLEAAKTWTFAPDDGIPPNGGPVRVPIFLHRRAGEHTD